MSKLLITTCTKAKTNSEFEQRPIFKSLQKHYDSNDNVDLIIFKDNKIGLSAQYNKVLKDPLNKDSTVLFVHDDVELDDLFLYEKLINSPYSITGLAGSKTFDLNAQMLAWHLASSKNDYVGEVAHMSKTGEVWTTVFGPTKSRALVIDGLFISCKVNDLRKSQIEFDEDFDFHFYDISLCLRANANKVTCGVLPIRVIHHGLGDSLLTNEWTNSSFRFKQKYTL
jgi:hypothetical protein